MIVILMTLERRIILINKYKEDNNLEKKLKYAMEAGKTNASTFSKVRII